MKYYYEFLVYRKDSQKQVFVVVEATNYAQAELEVRSVLPRGVDWRISIEAIRPRE